MSFHPLRSTALVKIPRKSPYVAPVDQYLDSQKDYSNRGYIVERTFHNFDHSGFQRTLPLEEYNHPEAVPSERTQIGTGASSVQDLDRKFLYGSPQPF